MPERWGQLREAVDGRDLFEVAILAVVLLQTFILLLIYPTGDNEKLEKRLAATEIWAQSAAARNEFALDLDKRIAKLER